MREKSSNEAQSFHATVLSSLNLTKSVEIQYGVCVCVCVCARAPVLTSKRGTCSFISCTQGRFPRGGSEVKGVAK
jgi:hypothetical protein